MDVLWPRYTVPHQTDVSHETPLDSFSISEIFAKIHYGKQPSTYKHDASRRWVKGSQWLPSRKVSRRGGFRKWHRLQGEKESKHSYVRWWFTQTLIGSWFRGRANSVAHTARWNGGSNRHVPPVRVPTMACWPRGPRVEKIYGPGYNPQ